MADNWQAIPGYASNNYTDTMVFEVDGATKQLQKISGQTLIAGEKNSQYIRFMMPRYWDGIDVSNKSIRIIYDLNNSLYFGSSEAVGAERTDDKIRFGWVVPAEACAVKGILLFVIIVQDSGYVLKTQITETPVLKSLNENGDIPEPTKELWYRDFQTRVERTLSSAENAVEEAHAVLEQARSFIGSPLVAETAAAMVDTERIYVYTGSESGYTSGNWYYYNTGTSAWTSGGVYNAVAVDTDTTLSISGKAADAKETGDQISELKSGFTKLTTATASDVGKALKAKTVTDGKVTEWEFGEAGMPSAANWSANAVQLLVGLLQSAVYTSDKSADIEALADELAYAEPTITGTLIKDWQFTGENPLVDKIDGSLAYAGGLISLSSQGAILPNSNGGANAFITIPLNAYNIDYVGTKVVVNFGDVYLDSMADGVHYRLLVPSDAENKVSTAQMQGLAYTYKSTKTGDFLGRSFFALRNSSKDFPYDDSIFGEDNPKLLEKAQVVFYFPTATALQIFVNGNAVYQGANRFTGAGIAFGANRDKIFSCAIKRIRIYKEDQA